MNKYILLVLVSTILFSCNKTKESDGFELKITLEGDAPNSVKVLIYDAQFQKTLDSAGFDNNTAVLKGNLDNPTACFVQFFGDQPSQPIQLFLENGKLELTGDLSSPTEIKLKGSASQDELQALIDEQARKKEEIGAIWQNYDEAQRAGDMDKAEMYMDEYRMVMDNAFTEMIDYVKGNPQSAVAAFITSSELMFSVEYKDLAEMAEGFKEKQPNSHYTKMILEKAEKMKTVAVGVMAPDFTQADPNGNPISLSSLRGKYVLIDFWASWCKPCRQENPNVVRMYNQYKDENFEILGVSLDQPGKKDRWLQAIEADGIDWLHVSDLKGWRNEVAQMYDVTSIPRTYLLDPEGKIIAKDLRGAELLEKMAELFPDA